MKVKILRQALERLEGKGRGDCSLFVLPTRQLLDASHRPGHGVIVGFDDDDYPIEGVCESFTRPEDADVIFLEFGMPNPIGAEEPMGTPSA